MEPEREAALAQSIEKAILDIGVPNWLAPMVFKTMHVTFNDGTPAEDITDFDEMCMVIEAMEQGAPHIESIRLVREVTGLQNLIASISDGLLKALL